MALYGRKKDLDGVVAEMARLGVRRAELAKQAASLGQSQAANNRTFEEATTGLEADWAVVGAAEERAAVLRERSMALAEEVDAAIARLTTLKVAATQAAERQNSARQTLERLRAGRADEEARAARIEATLEGDRQRAETLRVESVRLRAGPSWLRPRPRRGRGPTVSGRARWKPGKRRWPSARRRRGPRVPR